MNKLYHVVAIHGKSTRRHIETRGVRLKYMYQHDYPVLNTYFHQKNFRFHLFSFAFEKMCLKMHSYERAISYTFNTNRLSSTFLLFFKIKSSYD